MSNYMVYMGKQSIESPLHIQDVALLRRQYLVNNGKFFDSVYDVMCAVRPIIKFYGLVSRMDKYERGIEYVLAQHGAGCVVCVASGENRFLHIIKVEDHLQTLARFLAGKA